MTRDILVWIGRENSHGKSRIIHLTMKMSIATGRNIFIIAHFFEKEQREMVKSGIFVVNREKESKELI